MIYPQDFEIKIGFDKIRDKLKLLCLSNPAQLLVDDIAFSNNPDLIRKLLYETEEMIKICMLKDNYPASSFPDISKILAKLIVDGICLQLVDFVSIRTVLEAYKSINHFFSSDKNEEFKYLKKIISNIVFPTYVLDKINNIVSKNGTIKDTASPELKNLRKSMIETQNSVSKRLNSMLVHIKDSGWVNKDLSATIVNGRLVLPIESSHKRKIAGLIHDESASGKTSYIEPQEVVELNNNLKDLELEEAREIQRILLKLTEECKDYRDDLILLSESTAYLDLIRAKSLFSIQIEAIIPQIDEEPCIDIVRGKHPLLYLSLKREKKDVIPISFRLDKQNRILIISGPNAGGKSVSLKTTALLCYMTQCGLPIPVGGASSIGIFNNIFIDIGDQQSIENELSTYSSHLYNMKFFLKNANEKSLILIDEFGSGTDPIIGGTIAESILEELNKTGTFGLITTHYSNLKVFASNTSGVQNAAMLIDENNMMPTFNLEIGIPGSSYAIEIAQRIGISHNIIESAKEKIGDNQVNFDKLLRRTIRDKKYWENKRKQIKIQEKKLDEILEKNERELANIISKKKQFVVNAQKEADQMLSSVNKQIENTIKKIKESKADKEVTRQAREDLNTFKDQFAEKPIESSDEIEKKHNLYKNKISQRELRRKEQENKDLEIIKIDESKINIGSKVKIKGKDIIGQVTDINEKNAVVSFGNMYSYLKLSELEKVKASEQEKEKTSKSSKIRFNYNEKLLNFKPYIDIRGERVEEALSKITELIDEAIMLDIKEIKILHGKGTGVLRRYVRDYLITVPQVISCKDEDLQFGGSGITVVKL